MTVSSKPSAVPAEVAPSGNSAELGRTATAILATMVLLIVALTGILVETTWRNPSTEVEVLPTEPGSFARR
jgi:hypothetical protein